MNKVNVFELVPHYKATISVMGSASGYLMHNPRMIQAAQEVGRQIALHGCILGNGACPGLPDEAARGAKQAGGETYGVSPAISLDSHLKKYRSPVDNYDNILFIGMGLMMRDIINIRSADAVVILPGGTGTLNEFTVAYDEGKPMGILTGHDGIADHIKHILQFSRRRVTKRMVFASDPKKLIEKLVKIMRTDPVTGNLDDHLVGDEGEVTRIENAFHTIAKNQMRLLEV